MKKNLLSDCIKKRDDIVSQGLKNTSSSHDVPSPLLLSGTKVALLNKFSSNTNFFGSYRF